jgi:hypothetical protein
MNSVRRQKHRMAKDKLPGRERPPYPPIFSQVIEINKPHLATTLLRDKCIHTSGIGKSNRRSFVALRMTNHEFNQL